MRLQMQHPQPTICTRFARPSFFSVSTTIMARRIALVRVPYDDDCWADVLCGAEQAQDSSPPRLGAGAGAGAVVRMAVGAPAANTALALLSRHGEGAGAGAQQARPDGVAETAILTLIICACSHAMLSCHQGPCRVSV